MARRTVGPHRTDSHRTYVHETRIIARLSVLVLSGAIVWDRVNDGFWPRHALFTSLVASLIVVAVTAAVLNEVLERRVGGARAGPCSRKYVLFEFVRTARLVRSGLLFQSLTQRSWGSTSTVSGVTCVSGLPARGRGDCCLGSICRTADRPQDPAPRSQGIAASAGACGARVRNRRCRRRHRRRTEW